MQRFRGGLTLKARRPLYHSTPGLKIIKKEAVFRKSLCSTLSVRSKKQEVEGVGSQVQGCGFRVYTGTSLIRNSPLLEPYNRTVLTDLWWP